MKAHNIIPAGQLAYLQELKAREGASRFSQIMGPQLAGIEAALEKCPRLYETEDTPAGDKMIHLHYFVGGSDWWIAELDPEEGLAFGFACLNGDWQMAEWGYISIDEMRAIRPMQLDFHWEPVKFANVKK